MSVALGSLPLQVTVHRLRGHLAGLVDAQGRLHCPCRSRVLESALTLRLLAATGGHHQARARLHAFLESASAQPGGSAPDRILARAAMTRTPLPRAEDGDALAGFRHHTPQVLPPSTTPTPHRARILRRSARPLRPRRVNPMSF